MTVRELIIALLDMPLDAVVYRTAGEDPKANMIVQSVAIELTYTVSVGGTPPAASRRVPVIR